MFQFENKANYTKTDIYLNISEAQKKWGEVENVFYLPN